MSTLRSQLLLITAIVLSLALLLAALISRYVSRPIIETNQAAKALARGHFEKPKNGDHYREISELNDTLVKAADELSQVEHLQQELIANISHDLRTPLTMIGGYAEVMRDIPGENTPENMQIIIDETSRLSSLVTELLDFSKLQAGTLKMEPSVFSLTQAVTAILTRYNKLKEQEGYQILFEPAEECNVYADEGRIGQVIYNLINNALTYTGPDKTVTVTQTVEGDQVRIAVHDSGAGHSPGGAAADLEPLLPVQGEPQAGHSGFGAGAEHCAQHSGGAPRALWRGKPGGNRHHLLVYAAPKERGAGKIKSGTATAFRQVAAPSGIEKCQSEGGGTAAPPPFIRVSRLCGSLNLQKSNFLQFRTTAGWPKPLAGKSGCATLSTRCAAGRNPAATLLFSALEKATPAQPEGSHRELTSGFQGSGPAGLRVRSGRPCG